MTGLKRLDARRWSAWVPLVVIRSLTEDGQRNPDSPAGDQYESLHPASFGPPRVQMAGPPAKTAQGQRTLARLGCGWLLFGFAGRREPPSDSASMVRAGSRFNFIEFFSLPVRQNRPKLTIALLLLRSDARKVLFED